MRLAILLLAALMTTAGCARRAAPTAAAGAAAAATPDLRTWKMDEIETFLCSKYREDGIKLTAGTNGKYTGTRRSPDGTATMSLAVTVEADRVLCETKGGGLTTRDVVPYEGEIKSTLIEG